MLRTLRAKFIVQIKKNEHWIDTTWTRYRKRSRRCTGRAVTQPAAMRAMERAKKRFPDSEFRVAKTKEIPKRKPREPKDTAQ